jgi:hypothetical protein
MPSSGLSTWPARRASEASASQRLRVAHHHGVQGGGRVGAIVGVDARQVGLDQLDRRRAARLERVAQLGNGNLGYLDHAFTKKCAGGG